MNKIDTRVKPSEPILAPGEHIRLRRKEAGKTQPQTADFVGVSRQTIITLESGDDSPSVFLALKIADSSETTVEILWGAWSRGLGRL